MHIESSAEPVIRDFDWPDYPAVVAVWRAAGRDVMAEDEVRTTLVHGPDLMLVAQLDTEVGVVLGTFDGRRGWIHRLAVHPRSRRAGVATALVTELEQRPTDRGAPRINLLVMPDNTGGLAFWQRRGYVLRPEVLCSKSM